MSSLRELAARIAAADQKLLTRCWEHYCQSGEHTSVRDIFHEFGVAETESALSRLTGSLIQQSWGRDGQVYAITALGALVSAAGERLTNLLEKVLLAVKEAYEENHRARVLSGDVLTRSAKCRGLKISAVELQEIGRLLYLGPGLGLVNGGLNTDGSLYINLDDKISDIRRIEDFPSFISEQVMKKYDRSTPVSEIERSNRALRNQRSIFDAIYGQPLGTPLYPAAEDDKTSITVAKPNAVGLARAWAAVRAILEGFRFYDIKEIVGLAGVDLTQLAHLEQKAGGGASKGQLLTAVDRVFGELEEDSRSRFIRICAEEILRRRPDVENALKQYLNRLGWTLVSGAIIPLQLFSEQDLTEVSPEPREDLIKAAQRLRDGDLSGAISAACGAVDSVTSRIYAERGLGDPGSASFQERCRKALAAKEVAANLEHQLSDIGWDASDLTPFKKNFEGALIQGAYVMQTLRSRMGDVHGTKPIVTALVFDFIKWAEVTIRALEAES